MYRNYILYLGPNLKLGAVQKAQVGISIFPWETHL